jgi:hypothetical protein
MTEYVWKHLPYAIYFDTDVLRGAGLKLDAPWINELLSITNKYGMRVCISELVLAEWCEHIATVLESNRQKVLSSVTLLKDYGVPVSDIKPDEVILPKKKQLAEVVLTKLKTAGFDVIQNWDAPLSQLLAEAIARKPPFEEGGKGLSDAVILESYAEHAKRNFGEPRVLVVSHDTAVKRSSDRFSNRGIVVEFVDEKGIVEKLKSLLKDEVATYIEQEKNRLREYVSTNEAAVLEFVRKTPLEITDWMLNSPLRAFISGEEDRIDGTIESILSVRPTKITDVIGDAPKYAEELGQDRYAVLIYVELELDIVVRQYGFGFASFEQTRAIIQPDMIETSSPVRLAATDWRPQEMTKTIRRSVRVLASLEAQKEKKGILDDFRIHKIV